MRITAVPQLHRSQTAVRGAITLTLFHSRRTAATSPIQPNRAGMVSCTPYLSSSTGSSLGRRVHNHYRLSAARRRAGGVTPVIAAIAPGVSSAPRSHSTTYSHAASLTGSSPRAQPLRTNTSRRSALPGDLPVSSEVAALALAVPPIIGVLAWRATLYGQLEYIKAALLSNWVPKGGAVVLLSGGGTRDLYYMPKDTVKVTYVGEGLKKGLMENASIQAGVPVDVVDARLDHLSSQADNSADAVIGYGCLRTGGRRYLEEVARVLRPGCPFIFVDRVKGEGWQGVTQPFLGGGGPKLELSDLEALFEVVDQFDDVTCNLAITGDPHAVGVAMLLGNSDDEDLQEKRILSRKAKRGKRQGQR